MDELPTWAVLAAVGGIVGVDATSVGQFMISRPLVAATLGGWVFGRPAEGLVLGIALELFELCILPVGATRTPEGGTGALAAGAAYAVAGPVGFAAVPIALAVAFGLLAERLAGETVTALRRLNARLVGERALTAIRSSSALTARHTAAIGLDFLRGAVVSTAAALVGAWVLASLPAAGDEVGRAASSILGLALPAMAGAGAAVLAGGARVTPFLVGLAAGVGLWVVL
ncbi:MAG: PTS sugar transporter subunit IIC [Gemmatimonadota bacterium]